MAKDSIIGQIISRRVLTDDELKKSVDLKPKGSKGSLEAWHEMIIELEVEWTFTRKGFGELKQRLKNEGFGRNKRYKVLRKAFFPQNIDKYELEKVYGLEEKK